MTAEELQARFDELTKAAAAAFKASQEEFRIDPKARAAFIAYQHAAMRLAIFAEVHAHRIRFE